MRELLNVYRLLRHSMVLLAMPAVACSPLTDPVVQAGAVPMAPMAQYALWWRMTERCSQLSGDLEALSWYVVPGAASFGKDQLQGEYFPVSHRLVLAGRFTRDGQLVRHEMLHALLGNVGGHPAEYYQRRCGGIVACDSVCVSDGGPRPPVDSSGPLVNAADLGVTARVDSTAPSLARDSGFVALTIEVRNPRSTAVRVHLTPLLPGYFASATYGYTAAYCAFPEFGGANYAYATDSTMILGPGEAQRAVFDFRVWDVCRLVKPFFNNDTLQVIRIDPVP
jgi:hypothetical protein